MQQALIGPTRVWGDSPIDKPYNILSNQSSISSGKLPAVYIAELTLLLAITAGFPRLKHPHGPWQAHSLGGRFAWYCLKNLQSKNEILPDEGFKFLKHKAEQDCRPDVDGHTSAPCG